jgi:hypothetical protein
MREYDAFISHASEDKELFVRELAKELREAGFNIWYDELTLKVGSGLRRSIDQGLVNSDYGVVVLSESFFEKGWANYELDGLVALHIENPGKILPIWLGVSKERLANYSPSLANIVAVKATPDAVGIKDALTALTDVMGRRKYLSDENGNLSLASTATAVPTAIRQRGYEAIFSRQTDELVAELESISRSEVIIIPVRDDLGIYRKHFWQGAVGEVELVQSVAYDHFTGTILDFEFEIERNDGRAFSGAYHFKNYLNNPTRIVTEIRTTNQLEGIFRLGMDYMEFNNKNDISAFVYNFVAPDTEKFRSIRVSANDEEITPIIKNGKRIFQHLLRLLIANSPLKYNFSNQKY